ncbi:MAG: hypothetical protein HKP58_13555 [Desulfatitalea sp.]|nr:hypothetical protein [Desulfatitalea sp.]
MQDPRKKTNRWVINATRALRAATMENQKSHALVVDLDGNRMYTISEEMDEQARNAAAEKGFQLPGGIRIVDIQFPHKDRAVSGTTEIFYYPGGYSDQALIHLEDDESQRFAYKLEPLMPKIRVLEEWTAY